MKILPESARGRLRNGVAASELAVCLPVIVLLVLLTVESCSMIFVDQTLTIAAYEGARVATAPDSTNQMVTDKVNEIINARQVTGATVSTNPTDITTVPPGQPIEVTLSAPFAANSVCPDWFFGGKTLASRVTMNKE